MISSKKLSQLSKKLHGIGVIRRRKVTMEAKEMDMSCTSVAGKGNCIVYTADGRRFEIPLAYLSTTFFGELLRISQEFGFTTDERITLPCDAAVMEYVIPILRREASEDVERALLSSIVMPCHHINGIIPPPMGHHQQFAVCSS